MKNTGNRLRTTKATETRRRNARERARQAGVALAMIGCKAVRDGEEVEVIGADTVSYTEPMVRVLFPGGRIGVLRPSEVAR